MRLMTSALKTCGCFALAIVALPAAASAELPPTVIGSWIRQASEPAVHPALVMRSNGVAEIGGERCALDSLRAIHETRWYADFMCGSAATPNRVWLDISLLAANRIMVSHRPLGEADVYVRAKDGKK
jgi:hypothetical protein